MADSMLAKLVEERSAKEKFINDLTSQAMTLKRDLQSSELELIQNAQKRMRELDTQIDVLSVDLTLNQQAQDRIAQLQQAVNAPASAPDKVEYRSAGHYLQDYLRTIIGEGEARAEATQRLQKYHRAASHITTGNFTGIFPQAVVGPVINFINTSRPLVNALGTIGIPSGPSFRRPRLNDPNIATGVGIQANQKDELVSQAFTLTSDDVSLSTLGGYVNVARQCLDWGVASMDLIVNQLAARYSYATERAAIGEMSLSTGKVALAAGADGPTTIKAIYDGAAKVFASTGQLPSVLAAGPLGWARLGGLSDAAGRQIFPFLAPGNAAGQQSADSLEGNPVGLRLVVTPGITDDTFWVLNGLCLEVYEQLVGQLSVVEPSVLGIQVAYAGYTGLYRPSPNGAVHLAP